MPEGRNAPPHAQGPARRPDRRRSLPAHLASRQRWHVERLPCPARHDRPARGREDAAPGPRAGSHPARPLHPRGARRESHQPRQHRGDHGLRRDRFGHRLPGDGVRARRAAARGPRRRSLPGRARAPHRRAGGPCPRPRAPDGSRSPGPEARERAPRGAEEWPRLREDPRLRHRQDSRRTLAHGGRSRSSARPGTSLPSTSSRRISTVARTSTPWA